MDDIDSTTPEREMHWSQQRCRICDRYSKRGNNTIDWVCKECKAKKETETILEIQNVSGRIALLSATLVEKWKSYENTATALFAEKESFEKLQKKLKGEN